MKLNLTLFILFLSLSTAMMAQVAPDKYYIQFTDKNNSPYSIDQPEAFLSQRAIDRRAKYNIDITEEDLPVNPAYLLGVESAGATLLNPTKWMNGVTIYTADPAVVDVIVQLPYVESTVKFPEVNYSPIEKDYFANESISETSEYEAGNSLKSRSLNYGGSGPQIEQINGVLLHEQGFMGEGMVIAVLDGGFRGTDEHPFFDSLYMNNRMLGTKDFVTPGASVYTDSGHGNSVLSTMAAFSPGDMIGTAPRASYWLLRSEDVNTENVIEEYNWVSAAEFADSVGADVINSSLSYVDFDNPAFDYTYEDMDGMTCVSTRGADIAVEKGIMVVNSAGNSGNDPSFPYNGAPADGFNVFSIGAVDPDGYRASFSSIGPTYDGRFKPVVAATGQATFVAYGSSDAGYGNGTSFSSPIIAGMTACLMQAHPEMTVLEVQDALKENGSQSTSPDNLLGWGIPDYYAASTTLTSIEISRQPSNSLFDVYPNPFNDLLTLQLHLDSIELVTVDLIGSSGNTIFSQQYSRSKSDNLIQLGRHTAQLSGGIYYVRVVSKKLTEVIKIIKQ
jgi:hypothetical protein